MGEPRAELWSDHVFLRHVVQRSVAKTSPVDLPAPSKGSSKVTAAYSRAGFGGPLQTTPPPTPPLPPPRRAPPPQPPPTTQVARQSQEATTKFVPRAPSPRTNDNPREGWLPGFQVGFFPAH